MLLELNIPIKKNVFSVLMSSSTISWNLIYLIISLGTSKRLWEASALGHISEIEAALAAGASVDDRDLG